MYSQVLSWVMNTLLLYVYAELGIAFTCDSSNNTLSLTIFCKSNFTMSKSYYFHLTNITKVPTPA